MAKQTKTEMLATLVDEAQAASREHRQAQTDAQAAQAEVARRRDLTVEAHANGGDRVEAATKAYHQAERTLDEAKIKAEGLGRKAQRAATTVDQHMQANADELVEELRPQADELVAAMNEAIARLVELDARWNEISARVSEYVSATGLPVQGNVPSEHGVAQQIRDLRNVTDGLLTVESPMPNWKLRKIREQQHAAQAEQAARQAEDQHHRAAAGHS